MIGKIDRGAARVLLMVILMATVASMAYATYFMEDEDYDEGVNTWTEAYVSGYNTWDGGQCVIAGPHTHTTDYGALPGYEGDLKHVKTWDANESEPWETTAWTQGETWYWYNGWVGPDSVAYASIAGTPPCPG
ncbi:MAG: hypothetical protein ACE5IB_05225 [Candidatus Geothermarchaeales archaeon]